MSKILITGGAGFIGAHAARALIDRGDEVVLYDNFDSLLYPAEVKEMRMRHMFQEHERPRLVMGDILDAKLLNTVFHEEHFDAVLHFAALANPGRSMDAAEIYTMVNVMGTLNVLHAASAHDIVQFVFAGSSSVYNDEQTPFVETAYPLRPRSPYGASKAAAEQYCALWSELYHLPVTVLRFFSVYGPWGRPDMAPQIFAEHLLSDQMLEVTPERKRDFTYITDVIDGILKALDHKVDFEIMNIGRGEPVELTEFISALEKAAGKTMNVTSRKTPPGEMAVTYANTEKAKRLIGYEPKVSIEEGTKHLIDWVKSMK